MPSIKLVALPCICADVFDGTDIVRPGGEALNFAAHAAQFTGIDVALLGAVGQDAYADAAMQAVANLPIDTSLVRVDSRYPTANNRTYLTPEGDRYYKPDSWDGRILENLVLNEVECEALAAADVVFIHYYASCFAQVVELKKTHGFKLAVDFDVCRDFAAMEQAAPYVDFFMISGAEELLSHFRAMSCRYSGLFNVTLAERGSVTYHQGKEYRASAVPVEAVVDTTGGGDSYHAGFVCTYLQVGDILQAMATGSSIASQTISHYGGF